MISATEVDVVVIDVSLKVSTSGGNALTLGFGQKFGSPRVERRLQPNVQVHISKHRTHALASPRLTGQSGTCLKGQFVPLAEQLPQIDREDREELVASQQ